MKISIIIPVLNNWKLTEACLKSLHKHTQEELEILLVDNASTDPTPQEAPKLGQALFGNDFKYLPQPVNRNFSASCNLGARAAKGEMLFFLNNDTLVTPNWLPPLMEALTARGKGSTKAVDFVGPLLLYPELAGRKDRVQHLGIVFEPRFYPEHLYEGFPAGHPLCSKPRPLQAITGAAVMIPRRLFLQSGCFDEDFINGGEDIEFGLRLRKLGYSCKVVPSSRVYHLASQTPGIYKHSEHNVLKLKEKALSLIVPDLHIQARADGYRILLNQEMKTYLAPPEDALTALERLYRKDAAEETLIAMLDKEPLWHQGYIYLANAQKQTARYKDAADTLYLAARLKGGHDLNTALLETAKLAGEAKYTTYASSNLKCYNAGNFQGLINIAGFMVDFGRKTRVADIENAYSQWLENKENYRKLFVSD